MDLGLKDRVAVVTGSSKGIGKAIASSLAAEGCRVVLCARDKEALAAAADEIAKVGVPPLTVAADLAAPSGAARLIRETIDRWGGVDILVNNLGGPLHFASFMDLTDEDWRAELELDLMVPVRTCREVVPWMRRQGGGRIINISSMSGIEMELKFPDYRVAKAALIALSKYLSIELAPERILVNTVCPGAVWTPSWEFEASVLSKRNHLSVEETMEKLKTETGSAIPLGIGRPEDIGRLVAFLASPHLTWMTGSAIRIDGGGAKLMI